MARYGFLTIRASDAEPDMFEKLLIIFLPMLEEFPEYAYHVEYDGTPAKHLHVFFTLHKPFRDAEKITNHFLKKPMKQLRNTFQATDWKYCWKMVMVPQTKEDELKLLGYVVKENDGRKKIKGYSPKRLLDAVNYYILTQRLDKQNTLENDWKYLTAKNVHIRITEFCKEKNMTVHDIELIPQMVLNKTSFIQISPKQLKLTLAELKYHDNQNIDDYNYIQTYGTPNDWQELHEEIARLTQEVANQKALVKQIRQQKTKTVIEKRDIIRYPDDYQDLKAFYNEHRKNLD